MNASPATVSTTEADKMNADKALTTAATVSTTEADKMNADKALTTAATVSTTEADKMNADKALTTAATVSTTEAASASPEDSDMDSTPKKNESLLAGSQEKDLVFSQKNSNRMTQTS